MPVQEDASPDVTVAKVFGKLVGAMVFAFALMFGGVLYLISQHKLFFAYLRSWKPDGLQIGAHKGILLVMGILTLIVLALHFSPAEDNPRNQAKQVEKKEV